jgi:hypothetical protein
MNNTTNGQTVFTSTGKRQRGVGVAFLDETGVGRIQLVAMPVGGTLQVEGAFPAGEKGVFIKNIVGPKQQYVLRVGTATFGSDGLKIRLAATPLQVLYVE